MQAPPHALPFVPWRPLSIDSLDVLTEDVDRTIESFRNVLKERPGDVAAAKEEMERKMAVLFSFKKQHHSDERVVVVELLRLKLRKAIRETTDPLQRQSSKSPTSFQPLQAPKPVVQPQAPSANYKTQNGQGQSIQQSQAHPHQNGTPPRQSQMQAHPLSQLQHNTVPQSSLPQPTYSQPIHATQNPYILQQNHPNQQFIYQQQQYTPQQSAHHIPQQQSPPQSRRNYQPPPEQLSSQLYSQHVPSSPLSSQLYSQQSSSQPSRPKSPVRLPMQLQHMQQPQYKPEPSQTYQAYQELPAQNQFQTQNYPINTQYPPYQQPSYQAIYNSPHHQPVRLPMQLQQQHQKQQQQQPYQPPPIMLRTSQNETQLSLFPPTHTHYYINSAPTPEPTPPPTPIPYPQPHLRNRLESDTASQATSLSGYENGSERVTDYTTSDDVRSEFSTTSQVSRLSQSHNQQNQQIQSQNHHVPPTEAIGESAENAEPPKESEKNDQTEGDLQDLKAAMDRPQSKLFARLQAQEKEKKDKEKQDAPPKKKAWRKLQKPKPRIEPKMELSKEPKNIKPLYEWEIRNVPKPPPVKNITQSLSPTSPLSRAVEFKIVLTPAEFEQLQEKRNVMARSGMVVSPHTNFIQKNTGRLAYTKPDPEKTNESPFLLSSTPYVDPYLNESIRNTDKSKWVVPVPFFTTPPKRSPSAVPPQIIPLGIESPYAPRTSAIS